MSYDEHSLPKSLKFLLTVILSQGILTPTKALSQVNFPLVSNLKKTNTHHIIGEPPSLDEIYSVHQLKDVSPDDWAYDALSNLVQKYRCVAGFADGNFRGLQPISRDGFASILSNCLIHISRTIDQNILLKEDLLVIERLQEEFALELQNQSLKLNLLDNRIAFLEHHQFAPTTIVTGSVDFNLVKPEGSDKAALPGKQPSAKLSDAVTFSARSILKWDTSFTGQDKLRILLQQGVVSDYGRGVTGTDMTLLAGSTNTNRRLKVSTLYYQFPIGKSAIFAIAPSADFPTRVFPALNPVYAISNFGGESPIYSYASGSGAVLYYNISQELSWGVSYLTSTAANPREGIFNGQHTVLTQLTFTPTQRLGLAFTYGHYYAPTPLTSVNVTGSKGSLYGEYPFGAITPTASDDFGLQFTYKFTDKFIGGGWLSYFNATAVGSPAVSNVQGNQGSTAEIWSWALTSSLMDWGKLGSQLSFIFGMPPKVIRNDIATRVDLNTALHFELSYKYPINDNIFIIPGFMYIINPEHNAANPAIGIAIIRTTFVF